MRRLSALFACCLALLVPSFAHHLKPGASRTMPITTSSIKARDLFMRAMTDLENVHSERANIGFRAAVQADPNFALAYAWIAYNGRDPAEASAAREKAKALAPKVSPGEQLMIQWIVNVRESKYLVGIAAMNDMLEMYPHDKRLLFLAGNWIMGQSAYPRAQKMLERAEAIDKNYPAVLNDLGYVYAYQRQFDRAVVAMDRYAVSLPNEPNVQDSYAEILRMSGNFDDALQHYRAALKMDPEFVSSQLGLGDTYALMGDETRARAEYDKAIAAALTNADRLDYRLQRSLSFVREGNFVAADQSFNAVAETAHSQNLILEEAQAQRMMAMYATEDAQSLKHLDSAEDALSHPGEMAQSDREEEQSRILRWRAVRASHAGNQEAATKALQQLETMAGSGHSEIIQESYHAAAGALLVAQKKYSDAISHLEETKDDPFSMRLLSQAYGETGASDKMKEMQTKLLATNVPTIEQALVVVPGRTAKN